MFKNYKTMGAWAFAIALLSSCAKDTHKLGSENAADLTDGKISLSYNKNTLSKSISLLNRAIPFNRLGANSSTMIATAAHNRLASTTAQKAIESYAPSATGTAIEGDGVHSIDNASTVLVVPEGKTFSGTVNFNAGGTLIVLGIFSGNTNLHSDGTLEVGNAGTFQPASFNVNGSSSEIANYGIIEVGVGSVNGIWNNYNQVTFENPVNLNGGTQFTNFCKVVFEKSARIDGVLKNESYTVFKEGFAINGSGQLQHAGGAYTEVNDGQIVIDGKIAGGTTTYARLDINGSAFASLNASPAVTGKIDINFNRVAKTDIDRLAEKVSTEVTLDQDVRIDALGCTPAKGIGTCDENSLAFTLIASVKSPEVNAAILSATDVRIDNGFAYLSYHTNDEIYGNTPGGAVRVMDLQDITNPTLLSEVLFNNMEFNGIEVNANRLFATGQNKAGALLVAAPLHSGNIAVQNLEQIEKIKLPGASAKNSISYNNTLWVATGSSEGGLFALNASNGFETPEALHHTTRAKYVAKNDKYQVFFAVEPSSAYLRVAQLDGSLLGEYRFADLAPKIVDGKNTVTLDDSYAYIALSDRGVTKIDLTTGELKEHFEPNQYRQLDKKVFTEGGATNAVAADGCYLYLANGADGIIVLNKDSFQVVGSFSLPQSSNYIATKNGLLFVATGRDGLNIIKIN